MTHETLQAEIDAMADTERDVAILLFDEHEAGHNPTVFDLANQLKLTPEAVKFALEILVAKGLVEEAT